MALLAGGPILFNMILTAQMTKSLAQHLITTGVARSMANFGPATIKEQVEKEATAGWFRRCVDRIKAFGSGVGGAVNANILGWSGTYGILIFNNTSSLSHGVADPTAGTAVKLNPFNPDVLVASGWGYVDIDAGKSVNLHAAEDVVAEGKTVRIDAADKTVIQAGSVGKSSLVMEGALAFSKITMESGSSKISLTGGDETLSPRIILMAQRYPMNLLLTQSIEMDDISTTIGGSKPTTGFIRIDNLGIAMETKAATVKITPVGAVELKPVLKYTCNALGDVEIWGAKGVQVFSNAKTYLGGTAIDIGNNLTAQANVVGKLIKIGDGSGICQIKGANIQLG
jgi:hypothetical protein